MFGLNLWAVLGILAVVSGAFGTVYYKGYSSCQASQQTEIIKAEKKHDAIEKKTMSLSDIDLRKRYCKWVRDGKDKCLQIHLPID